MIFSSFEFLLFFIITLSLYYKLGAIKPSYAIGFLVLSSLFFYGWWKLEYLIILIISVLSNYFLAAYLRKYRSKLLLIIGISCNLLSLAYYKYAGFILININEVFTANLDIISILLPLAISFFTFQQIAFLVDTYKDPSFKYNFLNYSLFVTFFPQLIAGPIVHHTEMMPQFERQKLIKVNWHNIHTGFVFFALGLFKKIVIADTLALTANPVFNLADSGVSVSTIESWLGSLAYTFQLYFDFSGYADMAIGLGLMFNIMLPFNFNSPYKALNIVDFWRRWHITLSRFLRDYLYIALGGSRNGQFKRYRNLLLTMILGGLWHGAGWNFIIWGALHGSYLCINHGWNYISSKFAWLRTCMPASLALLITLLSVIIAWVFFRAITFDGAMLMLNSMFSYHVGAEIIFTEQQQIKSWLWIIIAFTLSVFMPNVKELTGKAYRGIVPLSKFTFLVGIYMMWILLINQQTQEFIYFNF